MHAQCVTLDMSARGKQGENMNTYTIWKQTSTNYARYAYHSQRCNGINQITKSNQKLEILKTALTDLYNIDHNTQTIDRDEVARINQDKKQAKNELEEGRNKLRTNRPPEGGTRTKKTQQNKTNRPQGVNLATDAQVSYIRRLLADHDGDPMAEGGFFKGPTTRREIELLTKQDASSYITSLAGNY